MRLLPTDFVSLPLAAIVLLAGCHHASRNCLESCDSKVSLGCDLLRESVCLTASLDHIPVAAADLVPPRTPSDPESTEVWEVRLSDVLAIALQNSEVIRTLTGTEVTRSLSTIYDPAIVETQIETALAAFDTTFASSIFWSRTDQPPGSTFGGGIPVANERDQASFKSSLSKLLATGAKAGIAFNTDYLFIPQFPTVTASPGPDGIFGTMDDVITRGVRHSPAQYTPNVEFSLNQPLLKGAGVDFNRAPVVIARLRSDQSLWDFKQSALSLVRSVEESYWELQATHVALRAVEEVLPVAKEVVRIVEAQRDLGRASPWQVGQVREQLAELRRQRTLALAAVLATEANLRNLVGLPPGDGRRLVPADEPLRVPIAIDWPATVQTALDYRPDVVRQRLAVRVRELELLVARNGLKPQLDVGGLWRINGLDHELDTAIRVLADNQFTDWQIGVSFSMPLGLRQAAADVRRSELQLDKEHAVLNNTVHSTAHLLNDIVRELDSLYQQYQMAEEQRQAAYEWVKGMVTIAGNPPERAGGGDPLLGSLIDLRLALQAWVSASTNTASLVSRYNTQLARLEEAKGTLLATDSIALQEDPCARVRFSQPRLPSVDQIDHIENEN